MDLYKSEIVEMEKKKLLFVYYKLFKPGGINRVLTNLANELVNEYDVTILLLMKEHDSFYTLDERIHLEFIDSFSHWGFRKINVNLDRYAKKLPKRRNIQNYVYDFGVKQLLNKWLEQNHAQFDTVITCMYKLSAQASLNSKINQKTIAWEHTDHNLGGVFYNKIRRQNYRKLKSIVAINSHSYKYYKELNPNANWIPNIIGEPFESLGYQSEKQNIISYVGRLDRDENVMELLEILKETDLPSDWKVQIIGDGPERKNLENFVHQNEMQDLVRFFGVQTSDEIVERLQSSKLFVFTSLKEAFALVLVEAMFCGNALVAYDCNFGPSDILDESNGFLVSLQDKSTFVEKLKELTQNDLALNQLTKSSYNQSKLWRKELRVQQWKEIL